MLDFVVLIAVLTIGVYLIVQSRKKNPRKVLDVYSQPGKWFCIKYAFIYSMISLRRLKYKLHPRLLEKEVVKFEKLQPLSNHEEAFDAVFFHVVSQNGLYLCCGTERRHNGKVNGLVYLVVPEYGILESEKLPSTVLTADPVSLLSQAMYAAEGLVLTPVEPMKKWKVNFNGKMRVKDDPGKFVNVELQGEWTSDLPWFLFETDIPAGVLGRAIAREEWTKEYFEALKEAHQTHYEQMGYLNGTLKINGKTTKLVEVDAFRDHSFGKKRDWSLMHRYIFHMFYLEDGTKISFGVVSQPSTSSSLEMGYVCHPRGRIDPVSSCDLLLYQHAEDGVLPDEICFTITAGDVLYEISVRYLYDSVHYKGSKEEAKMCERFHECTVNGVKGRGISEWHYNVNDLKRRNEMRKK